MKKIVLLLFSAVFVIYGFNSIPNYTKQELIGKIDPYTHKGFTKVKSRYTDRDIYLRKEVNRAFEKMAKAATKDGINLYILSGTRTYTRQSEIWEDKWNRFEGNPEEKAREILRYSSMPGTSRHHWGTDFDLNSLEPEFFETKSGEKIYSWLESQAWKFGFFQPYNKLGDNRKRGYKEEKWHWSYYPTASQLLRAYNNLIEYQDILGFEGAELGDSLDVFDHYVNAIYIPKNLEFQQIRNQP
ncbi:MAG: M15 family metallopeptidase [Schleiferiaceae bacterium]|jgi:LAS superfamily LD-carboxypeptidase LdcB|nr:M15 family metallopeptidase [Schleiferiaceae bacterium]